MNNTTETFLKTFLPSTVKDMYYTQLDLDITDLSISDILRNINKLYPVNTKNRMLIEDGQLVLGVMCKTETIDPYNGVLIFICGKDVDINVVSCNYIVLSISEERIRTEINIQVLIDSITDNLIRNYASEMRNFPDFYRKFVYDESELYEDGEDYITENY